MPNLSVSAGGGFNPYGELQTVSDAAGRFRLERVPPGKVSVTAAPSQDEILEHIHVFRIDDFGVDLDCRDLLVAVGRSDHHAATRVALCTMTAQVLQRGLALLGIETPERM